MILLFSSYVEKNGIGHFLFKPTPIEHLAKEVSIDLHYEAKNETFRQTFKKARSDVFWCEDSRSGLKIQIGKHLIHFLAKKLLKSWEFLGNQENP